MADTDSLSGQTVSHYRIIERLGGGGIGFVHRKGTFQYTSAISVYQDLANLVWMLGTFAFYCTYA